MPFSIQFLDTPVPKNWLQHNEKCSFAEIIIGDFSERILIPTDYWSQLDYSKQWRETVLKLTHQSEDVNTALITEMYDPNQANFLKCWPLYKREEWVYIQNKILFLDQLSEQYNPKHLSSYIDDRQTDGEDGEEISEWGISLAELKEWADSLMKQ